jgi:antirestriction protein
MGQAAENLEPRIYVACLAAYNSGWLHGAWIEVEDDADAVGPRSRDAEGLAGGGAEEFAIHDHEGFGGVEIAEYARDRRVVADRRVPARRAGGLGPWCWSRSAEISRRRRSALDEQYRGVFSSLADCFQELTEETTVIPESLRLYIDWEAMAATRG